MQHARVTDYSPMLDEFEEALTRFYREREMAVMAQPQMVERPSAVRARSQTPKEMKSRLEKLPDFDEQIRTNERFRQVYERVVAALDL